PLTKEDPAVPASFPGLPGYLVYSSYVHSPLSSSLHSRLTARVNPTIHGLRKPLRGIAHSRLTARVNPTIHGLRKPLRGIVGLTLAVNLGPGPPRNLPEVHAYGMPLAIIAKCYVYCITVEGQ